MTELSKALCNCKRKGCYDVKELRAEMAKVTAKKGGNGNGSRGEKIVGERGGESGEKESGSLGMRGLARESGCARSRRRDEQFGGMIWVGVGKKSIGRARRRKDEPLSGD